MSTPGVHEFICNNFHSPDIDKVLNEFDDLKTELQSIYIRKGNATIFRSRYRWVEKGVNETIIKKETQVLATIQNYFNDLSTSARSVTQEERYDSLIDLYSGTAPS